ncbi:MAG TPA: homoserine kinase [Burkholderiales bacterium]|nr:homoserine kinase [Burkholderiales bacterium]
MSVFTTVTPEQLAAWLKRYSIGVLVDLRGIASGIENTNYYVTTTQGRFVLTLFEKLKPRELPFYLDLMAHLSSHGIPSPKPIANLSNAFLDELNGKPAAIATCLEGQPVMEPGPEHCARVGEVLAELHLAGQTYGGHLENLRGPRWWTAVAPEIYPFLSQDEVDLLKSEIRFQAGHRHDNLPRGVIHADLFRDNVLFHDSPPHHHARVGGFIDFYFACVDVLIYDVAIAVNDWCMNADCALNQARSTALLAGYKQVRPFTEAERVAWPVMLRAGALRFWVSRLYDFYLPRSGELTHAHDPERFRRILLRHIEDAATPLRLDG